MHNHHLLKKLLAVSAVAAMFSVFGAHAQTGGSSTASGTGQDATSQAAQTTREGTAGNSNSRGEQQHGGSAAGSSAAGQSGMSGASDSTGGGTTSRATRAGMADNASSQGMEQREGASGASGAGATAAGSDKLSSNDEKILKDFAQTNIDEIEAAKLAQSKSQNEQVKSFAQQMIDDHTKALNDAQQLAQQKGVTLPTEPDAKHKAMANKLEAKTGKAFDEAYMSQAGVADHKKAVSKLKSEIKRAKDADLKALLEKTEPVIEQHLKSAKQDKSAMAATTSGK